MSGRYLISIAYYLFSLERVSKFQNFTMFTDLLQYFQLKFIFICIS